MGKYYFNTKLFVSLRSILGVSTEDMALAAENSTHRVRAWTREGDVPLYALIGICNEYHIPIRHFIVTDEDPEVILSRKRYVVGDEYKETMFLNVEFGNAMTVASGQTVAKACSEVGISLCAFYASFRDNEEVGRTFRIKKWLSMCNIAKLYPGDYFVGDTGIEVLSGYKRVKSVMEDAEMNKTMKMLQNSNMRLKRQVKELKEKCQRMRGMLEGMGVYMVAEDEGETESGRSDGDGGDGGLGKP